MFITAVWRVVWLGGSIRCGMVGYCVFGCFFVRKREGRNGRESFLVVDDSWKKMAFCDWSREDAIVLYF